VSVFFSAIYEPLLHASGVGGMGFGREWRILIFLYLSTIMFMSPTSVPYFVSLIFDT
jgi:hypothetical protein